jgi:hypothetical protein
LLLDKLYDKPTTTAVFIHFVFDDIKKNCKFNIKYKKNEKFII